MSKEPRALAQTLSDVVIKKKPRRRKADPPVPYRAHRARRLWLRRYGEGPPRGLLS